MMTNSEHHLGRAQRHSRWSIWNNEMGVVNVQSGMVGALILSLTAGIIIAGTTFILPRSQNNAAIDSLSAVHTAQSSAMVTFNRYFPADELISRDLFEATAGVTAGTDADGSCYVGVATSMSGDRFYVTDTLEEPAPLTDATAVGCTLTTGTIQELAATVPADDSQEDEAPDAPVVNTTTTLSGVRATFTWNKVPYALAYNVEYRIGDGTWVTHNDQSAGTTADINGEPGKTVSLRVQALNKAGASPYSAAVTSAEITGLPAAPTVTGALAGSKTAHFTWAPVAGAASYTVDYRLNGGEWTAQAASQSSTAATVTAGLEDIVETRVRAVNSSGASDWASSNAIIITEAVPAPVVRGEVNNGTAQFTWPAVGSATGYKVESRTNNGIWATVSASQTGTSATVSGAMGDRVSLRVQSLSATGDSGFSSPVTVELPIIPSVPAGLTGEAISNTEATFKWTASAYARGYRIETSINGGAWTVFQNEQPTTSVTIKSALYDEISVRVQAVGTAGTSAFSPASSVSLPTLPAVPVVTARAEGARGATFTWPAADRADKYRIEKALNNGAWESAGADTTARTLTLSGNPGDVLRVRVSSVNVVGASAASTAASFTLASLPASPVVTGSSVDGFRASFTWGAVPAAGSYTVEHRIDGGSWQTSTQMTTSYSVTVPQPGQSVEVRVTTVNPVGSSAVSDIVKVDLPVVPGSPSVSGELISNTEGRYTWSAVTGADTYTVERRINDGAWSVISSGGGSTSITLSASLGDTVQVRVAAVNRAGVSAFSQVAELVHPALPAAPDVTAELVDATGVRFLWTDVLSATNGYTVQKSVNGGTWTTIATATADRAIVVRGTAGQTIALRVQSLNGAGASPWSATAQQALPAIPATPAAPVGESLGTAARFTWSAVTGAASYRVETRIDGGSWTVQSAQQTALSITVAAGHGAVVEVRVAASNIAGTSAFSPAATVTLPTLPESPVVTGVLTNLTTGTFSWPAVSGATGYWVEQKIIRSGSDPSEAVWELVSQAQSATTHAVAGLAGDVLSVRARALSPAGESVLWSNESPVELPAAPATPANAAGTVENGLTARFTWDASERATSYRVETSVAGGAWTVSATNNTTRIFTINGSPGQIIQARITAVGDAGSSAPTAPVSVTLDSIPASPAVTGTVNSATTARFTWSAVPTAASYRVEVRKDGGTWTVVQPAQTTTSTLITGTAGQVIDVRVSATNAAGTSAPGLSTVTLPVPPAAPVVAGTVSAGNTARFDWGTDPAATSYRVEYRINTGTWTVLSASQQGTSATVAGTYGDRIEARVTASNIAGSAVSNIAAVQLPALPSAPASVTGTAVSSTQARFDWPAGTGATSYRVETSVNGGAWTLAGTTTNTYQFVNGTSGNTISVRVQSVSSVGSSTGYATSSAVTLPSAVPMASPPSPVGQVLTATTARFSWSAVTGADSYSTQCNINDGTWTTLSTTVTGTSIDCPAATAGTKVGFRAASRNAAGISAFGTAAYVTLPVIPAAPTVTGNAVNGTTATFTWPAVSGATSYEVQYQYGGGATVLAEPANTSRTITLTGGTQGGTVTVWVKAVNLAGSSASSSPATVTLPTVPAAPSATAYRSTPTEVSVSWSAVSGADSYWVSYRIDSGAWTVLNSNQTARLAAVSAAPGQTVYFAVRGTNLAGQGPSAYLAGVTLPVITAAPVPSTPTPVDASSARVSWPEVSGATYYLPEYRNNGGAWVVMPNHYSTQATSANGAPGTVVDFRVRAGNEAGNSVYSATVSVTLPQVPAAPTPTATVANATSIQFTWPAVPGAASYILQKSVDGGTPVALGTFASTSQTLTGTAGQRLALIVWAVNSSGSSASGTASEVLPVPPASPVITSAVHTSGTSGTVTWAAVAGAASYRVETQTGAGAWITTHTAATGTTVTVTGAFGQTTTIRVSATNMAGTSAASTTASYLTPALPGAPTVTGVVTTGTTATFSWPAVSGATSYEVTQQVNGGSWSGWTSIGSATSRVVTAGAGQNVALAARAVNASGTGTGSSTVTVTMPVLPTAPVTTTIATGGTSVNVTWPAITNAESYAVEHRVNAGTWVRGATQTTAGANLTGFTEGDAVDVRVQAYNKAGWSAFSAITGAVLPVRPAAPVVTGVATSGTAARFTWPAVSGAEDYRVHYRIGDGTDWNTLEDANTSRSVIVTGAAEGQNIRVWVYSRNLAGFSTAYSNIATVRTPVTPAPPVSVDGAVLSGTSVKFSWPAVANADSYQLYTVKDGVSTLFSNTHTGTTATVTGLANGESVQFAVGSRNLAGVSASQTPSGVVTTPTIPVGTTVTGELASGQTVNFTWNAIDGVDSYLVQQSIKGGAYTTISSTGTATTASVTGVASGDTIQLRVSGVNLAGSGPLSYSSTLTYPYPPSQAPVVSGALAEGSWTLGEFSWPAVPGADAYRIELSLDGAPYYVWQSAYSTTSFSLTRSPGGSVSARVTAYNIAGYGPTSNTPTVIMPVPPATPTNVTMTKIYSPYRVEINWDDLPAGHHIEVERDYASGTRDIVSGTTWTKVQWTVPADGGIAYVRVRSVRTATGQPSAWSSRVSERIPPSPPSAPTGLFVPSTCIAQWLKGTLADEWQVIYTLNGTTPSATNGTVRWVPQPTSGSYATTKMPRTTTYTGKVMVAGANWAGIGPSDTVSWYNTTC